MLGEVEVLHTTAADLVGKAPARGLDPTETAVLKGDPRMAELLRRAVWDHVGTASEALVVPRGARKWRVAAYCRTAVLRATESWTTSSGESPARSMASRTRCANRCGSIAPAAP